MPAWKRESLGEMRLSLVKCRIEAGYLRNVRRFGHDRLDRRQIVRLVKRSERHQGLQRAHDVVIDDDRLRVRDTPVDDPMADRVDCGALR